MAGVTVLDIPVRSAVVCHPEPLLAASTAEVLLRRGAVRSVSLAHTFARVLSCLDGSMQVVVVFDSVDEDIADLFEACGTASSPRRS